MKIFRKIKMLTSTLLATTLLCSAAVTAIAAEQTTEDPETEIQTIVVSGDDIGEETEEDVQKAVNQLTKDVDYYELEQNYPGTRKHMYWSEATLNRLDELKTSIHERHYTTMEEVNEDRERLNEFLRTATISEYELEFMLDILSKESNSTSYYDEEMWNEFISVYEECKQAVNSDDDEVVHIAYAKARNILNKLCLYNKTMGDVNNDGVVNVKDSTLLQMAVVEEVQLTLSQVFVCNFLEWVNPTIVPDVKDVTELQKFIVEDSSVTQFDKARVTSLEAYPEFEFYPENRVDEFWNSDKDYANYIYSCYFNDRYIWWM